jgi:glycosyltransferase involved in cell wall biosynthesis
VAGGDPGAFARAIVALLDDPARRDEMGRSGRLKFERELAWEHQADAYVRVYDRVFNRARLSAVGETPPAQAAS